MLSFKVGYTKQTYGDVISFYHKFRIVKQVIASYIRKKWYKSTFVVVGLTWHL